MTTSTGRPRPFLNGVFRTACNYCVSSKRGCSGGEPCDQCEKRGKPCIYAQRRKSGPRSRPASGRSSKGRSRTKARRESRAAAAAAAAATAAAPVESPSPVIARSPPSPAASGLAGEDRVGVGAGSWDGGEAAAEVTEVERRRGSIGEDAWERERRRLGFTTHDDDHHLQQEQQQQSPYYQPAGGKRKPPALVIPRPHRTDPGSTANPLLVRSSPAPPVPPAPPSGRLEVPMPPRSAHVLLPPQEGAAGSFGSGGDGSCSSSSSSSSASSSFPSCSTPSPFFTRQAPSSQPSDEGNNKRTRVSSLTPPAPRISLASPPPLSLTPSSSCSALPPRGCISSVLASRCTSVDGGGGGGGGGFGSLGPVRHGRSAAAASSSAGGYSQSSSRTAPESPSLSSSTSSRGRGSGQIVFGARRSPAQPASERDGWVKAEAAAPHPVLHSVSPGSAMSLPESSAGEGSAGMEASSSYAKVGSSWAATAAAAATAPAAALPRLGAGYAGGDFDDMKMLYEPLLLRKEEDKRRQLLEEHRWEQEREQQREELEHERLLRSHQEQEQQQHLRRDQLLSRRQMSLGALLMADDDELGESFKQCHITDDSNGPSGSHITDDSNGPSRSVSSDLVPVEALRRVVSDTAQSSSAPAAASLARTISPAELPRGGPGGVEDYASSSSTSTAWYAEGGGGGVGGGGGGGGIQLEAGDGDKNFSLRPPSPPHRRVSGMTEAEETLPSSPWGAGGVPVAAAAAEGSWGRGQPLLPRAVPNGNAEAAATARPDCAALANMRTPLTREASLMRAVEASAATSGGYGGGGKQVMILENGGMNDIRAPLLREASLMRAMEAVNSFTTGDDGGVGDCGEDTAAAAAELISSAGGADDGLGDVFCETSAAALATSTW